MKNVLMVLICLPVIFNTTAQPPSTAQRMIGYSTYIQDQQQITFYDSGSLTYSGTRGSDYNFDDVTHTGVFNYFELPVSPDNRFRCKADVWTIYTTDLSIPDDTGIFTYNADDKVTDIYFNSSLSVGNQHTIYTYNGPDIDFAEHREYNGSGWDILNRAYFKYNGGLLVEDSSIEKQGTVWSKFWKFKYSHDMNGNLTNLKSYQGSGNIFKPYSESQVTYNTNKQIVLTIRLIYDQTLSAMALITKDSFVYVTGVNFWVKHYSYNRDKVNNTWKPDFFIEKQLNAQMLPETVTIHEEWDGSAWAPENIHKYIYNSFGNPVHDSSFNYIGGVMQAMPASIYHYYYEDYQLGVAHAPVISKIKVYPNPALDMLTVSCDNVASFKVELVNFLGQTVKKISSYGDARFSIEDLIPGVYCLTVCDIDGNKLHRQTIVKQ